MFRGLWTLTWLETKIFLREPLGAIGTVVIPVVMFVLLGRAIGSRAQSPSLAASAFLRAGLPVLVSIVITPTAQAAGT